MTLGNYSPQKFFALSGKIGSGKDTCATLLQIMTSGDTEVVTEFYDNPLSVLNSYSGIIESQSRFKNKKFANDVKFIVSHLLGVTVRKLEDRDFKETELDSTWWYYRVNGKMISYKNTEKYTQEDKDKIEQYLIKLTPRRLFQLIGTEGGRDIIHPDIWVNSLFAKYVVDASGQFPDWIISDVRFLNEYEACKERGAITIRVIRRKPISEWLSDYAIDIIEGLDEFVDCKITTEEFIKFLVDFDSEQLSDVILKLTHESEIQLDDVEHDYVIYNDGTIESLVNNLVEICKAEDIELTGSELGDLELTGGLI